MTSTLEVSIRKELAPEFSLDVSFAAPPGITMLFGPSGAGKTTLLDCIAGLAVPDSGRILLDGTAFFDQNQHVNVSSVKRQIGYLFQSLALFPHLSVEGNIRYGLDRLSRGECAARMSSILDAFHIADLRKRRPASISGGERQRVALARALVTDPRLLLLDEPLSALDDTLKRSIMDDLRAWNASHSIPILYVTHSREELFALGERVITLEKGRIVAQGDPHQVLAAPRQESIAQLAGFENIFDATITAAHERSGTMTCRIGPATDLEVPLGHAEAGDRVRVAVRAGDILLANAEPSGLSARNILPGTVLSLTQRDYLVTAKVDCGAQFEVHLTPAAEHSLGLKAGSPVWLVIKTHSCHLVR